MRRLFMHLISDNRPGNSWRCILRSNMATGDLFLVNGLIQWNDMFRLTSTQVGRYVVRGASDTL